MAVTFNGGKNESQLVTTCPACGEQGIELLGQQGLLPGRRMFRCNGCRRDYMEHAPQPLANAGR